MMKSLRAAATTLFSEARVTTRSGAIVAMIACSAGAGDDFVEGGSSNDLLSGGIGHRPVFL